MQAGRLRSKVTLQERIQQQNEVGEELITYADLMTLYASIEPISGREFFAAEQILADITTRIRCRYIPMAEPTMRIRFIEINESPQLIAIFDIEAVLHTNQRRRETILMCRKRYAKGIRGNSSGTRAGQRITVDTTEITVDDTTITVDNG